MGVSDRVMGNIDTPYNPSENVTENTKETAATRLPKDIPETLNQPEILVTDTTLSSWKNLTNKNSYSRLRTSFMNRIN